MEKTKLKLQKMSNTFDLTINSDTELKIRKLCKRFPTREWSGVLFYDCNGSFENNDLSFVAKDFLLMDIGNATYTEYNADNLDIATYMAMNPDLLDCHTGNIHSHNQMQAFFSGTDDNTLLQEGTDVNNFLSLVVNNAGKYVARFTRRVKYETEVVVGGTYKMFDKDMTAPSIKWNPTVEAVQYYDLNIIVEPADLPYDEFEERIEEIDNKSKTMKTYLSDFQALTDTYPSFDKYESAKNNLSSVKYDSYSDFVNYNPTGAKLEYSEFDKPVAKSTKKKHDPTLPFDDDYMDYKDYGTGKYSKKTLPKLSSEHSYDLSLLIPKELVEKTCLRLVCGTYFIGKGTKLERAVSTLEKRFKENFDSLTDGDFIMWMEDYVMACVQPKELYEAIDDSTLEDLELYDSSYGMSLDSQLASLVLNRLNEFKSTPVLDFIKKQVEKYTF